VSLTPIDTPGNIGATEPVDFTLSSEPTVVGVRYFPEDADGNPVPGPWDVVYGGTDASGLDGVFSDRYASSERVGNTWTIRPPAGVWPCRFRVYVDYGAPTLGAPMGAIYEVDFTSLPTQPTAPGSYTFDGLTWWAKGNDGAGGASGMVNGAGLRIYQPSTVDTANAWALWRNQGIVTLYKARLFSLSLAQLPDYNPLAPLVVMWRFTSNQAAGDDPAGFAGLGEIVASGAVLTGAEKNTCLTLGGGPAGNVGYRMIPPYSTTYAYKTEYVSTVAGAHVNGLYRLLPNRFAMLHNTTAWAGTMPPLESMNDVNPNDTGGGVYTFMSSAPNLTSSPSFVFGIQKGATGPTLDVHLTHLKIMQPKAA